MNHLYLIRHGENRANLTKEFSSRRVDYPLTAKGILQARQTAEALADQHIDEIYASPLKRAAQTAAIIGERLGLPVTILENFREIQVGELEEQPVSAENWALHDSIVVGWLRGHPEVRFPGGENLFDVKERYFAGLRQVTDGKDDRRIVIVAHGGILTFTLPDLIRDVEADWLLTAINHNCSISEVLLETGPELTGRLVCWAACDHLSGEAAQLVSGLASFDENGNLVEEHDPNRPAR